jgi:hypothetical protein
MCPTSSQDCLVAYERRLVSADIAQEFAQSLGAAIAELQNGLLDDAGALRPHQMLLCPEDAALNAYVNAFERSVRQFGETPRVGLVSGINMHDLREKCRKLMARPARSGCPWILTDEGLEYSALRSLDRIPHAGMTPETLLELGARNAPVAVIVGHGREDIVYFGSAAFCGRRSAAPNTTCFPDHCSYMRPKAPIEGLSADILILLSCNAGRFGGGLMPADCRLGLSALGASSTVIAPRRLYTHSKALTDLVVECIFAGMDASEITARADAFQLENFGEERVFVIFGDPRTRFLSTRRPVREQRALPQRYAANAKDCQRLIRFCDALDSVGVCAEDAGRVSQILEQTLASDREQASTTIPAAEPSTDLSAIEGGLMRLVSYELRQRIGGGYFWISNEYRLASGSETVEPCPRCGGEAARQAFGHFRYGHCDRTRLTCWVCGIVEDRPLASPCAITEISVSASGDELGVTVDTRMLPAMLVVGLNGNPGTGFVRSEEGSIGNSDPISLTAGRTTMRFVLDKAQLKPGVYFFKVFVVAPDGIAEATAPIQTWEPISC